MRKIGLLIAFVCSLMAATSQAQMHTEVVRAFAQDKSIVVEYDLALDADVVRLYVSLDGGETYRGPLQQVSGDVSHVTAGYGHRIVWNVLKEMDADSFDSEMVRFKLILKLKERWPKESFVTLNASYASYPQGAMGFSVGQVRRFGWFVSMMSNGSFSGFGDKVHCDKNGFIEEGYLPRYSGAVSKMRFSVMGGGLMRLSGPWIARVGLGYGIRSLCWETEDGVWVRNDGYSVSGLEVSAGLQWHWKGFVFSAEAVTTRFQNVEARIGVGVCF